MNHRKTFEVKFSAFEFLAASSRLSPLNLEGMEHFVSVMLEKAINGRHKMAESIKQHNLFPKASSKKNEKSSNFCTIRNPTQQQQQKCIEPQNINNNNNNNKEEVLIFGQSSPSQVSCSKCRQNEESSCQKSFSPSSHPLPEPSQQVLSSHNYQSLYQIVPENYQSSSSRAPSRNGGTKAYTTLEALNQDMRGMCKIIKSQCSPNRYPGN